MLWYNVMLIFLTPPVVEQTASSIHEPQGLKEKRSVLLLYWDYELQKGDEQSRSGTQGRAEDYKQTERLLELLEHFSLRATFAVLGFCALPGGLPYHAADQIKKIADMGHEVASHSWEHEWIPNLTYDNLVEILSKSKKILAEVTGREVVSFAPPHNVPCRYLRKTALGWYQSRRSEYNRIDIPLLCKALRESGYKTCRITYENIFQSIARHAFRKVIYKPYAPERIEGIWCFRVGTPGGFSPTTRKVVDEAVKSGKIAVVYAHPHSLTADNWQNEKHLIPFLEHVSKLQNEGKLWVTTPSELLLHLSDKANSKK